MNTRSTLQLQEETEDERYERYERLLDECQRAADCLQICIRAMGPNELEVVDYQPQNWRETLQIYRRYLLERDHAQLQVALARAYDFQAMHDQMRSFVNERDNCLSDRQCLVEPAARWLLRARLDNMFRENRDLGTISRFSSEVFYDTQRMWRRLLRRTARLAILAERPQLRGIVAHLSSVADADASLLSPAAGLAVQVADEILMAWDADFTPWWNIVPSPLSPLPYGGQAPPNSNGHRPLGRDNNPRLPIRSPVAQRDFSDAMVRSARNHPEGIVGAYRGLAVKVNEAREEKERGWHGFQQNAFQQNGVRQSPFQQNTFQQSPFHQNPFQQNPSQQTLFDQNGVQQNTFQPNGFQPNGIHQNRIQRNAYQQNAFPQNVFQQNVFQQNVFQQNVIQQNASQQNGFQQNGFQPNGAQ